MRRIPLCSFRPPESYPWGRVAAPPVRAAAQSSCGPRSQLLSPTHQSIQQSKERRSQRFDLLHSPDTIAGSSLGPFQCLRCRNSSATLSWSAFQGPARPVFRNPDEAQRGGQLPNSAPSDPDESIRNHTTPLPSLPRIPISLILLRCKSSSRNVQDVRA